MDNLLDISEGNEKATNDLGGGSQSKIPVEVDQFGAFCPTRKPYLTGSGSKAWDAYHNIFHHQI